MSKPIIQHSLGKGFYPERKHHEDSKLEETMVSVAGNLTRRLRLRMAPLQNMLSKINDLAPSFDSQSDSELRKVVANLRRSLNSRGLLPELVEESFALIRELSFRTLGKRHYDVQVLGGLVLLNGRIAEMETGEGKTLTATLAASTAALAGLPVHVITVNDYLAERDAETMTPLYKSLGLTVGVVKQGMSPDERRVAYRKNITYVTNKEVVFDYLKDRLAMGQRTGQIQMRLQRLYRRNSSVDKLILGGLVFGIVDEADSVLIDEARTPLIISGPGDAGYQREVYGQALSLARELAAGEDYSLELAKRRVELTERGKLRLVDLSSPFGGIWEARQWREELIRQALSAIYLFMRDRDYIVRDGKVQIVDEYTGRIMGDRSWERGLHQLVETKEECDLSAQNETLAKISYQRFFRRYLHLCGMTGTAKEVAGELWSVYRLDVMRVPTNRPVIRYGYPCHFYKTEEEKWRNVVERIRHFYDVGRPVLVGTRSVAVSEYLSGLLTEADIPHRVLNARQDKEEANVVAEAGQKGCITVATNMAGRGTDISIPREVLELGGLHVIATELHDTRRIDRQLFGRCGRQGDPGSYEAIVSLRDELFLPYELSPIFGRFVRKIIGEPTLASRAGSALASFAQWMVQRRHLNVRRQLLKMDDALQNAIAFSGRGE